MGKSEQALEGFALIFFFAEDQIDLLLLRRKIGQDHVVDKLVRVGDGGQETVSKPLLDRCQGAARIVHIDTTGGTASDLTEIALRRFSGAGVLRNLNLGLLQTQRMMQHRVGLPFFMDTQLHNGGAVWHGQYHARNGESLIFQRTALF